MGSRARLVLKGVGLGIAAAVLIGAGAGVVKSIGSTPPELRLLDPSFKTRVVLQGISEALNYAALTALLTVPLGVVIMLWRGR